jgi:hypothetical protein
MHCSFSMGGPRQEKKSLFEFQEPVTITAVRGSWSPSHSFTREAIEPDSASGFVLTRWVPV